jgi:hypothetical protein
MQCGVYAVIAAYARTCRLHTIASALVLLMAIAAIIITAAIAYHISPPIGYGVVVWVLMLLFLQAAIAIFGCYFGYAMVECRRLRHYRGNGPKTTH